MAQLAQLAVIVPLPAWWVMRGAKWLSAALLVPAPQVSTMLAGEAVSRSHRWGRWPRPTRRA